MSHKGLRSLALVTLLALLLPMVLACGSPQPTGQEPKPTAASGGQAPAPTEVPSSGGGSTGGDPSTRVSDSLTLLLGSGDKASVFASYHIAVDITSPAWDGDAKAVVGDGTKLDADVQGKNIHLTYKSTKVTNGETEETGSGEGIVLGDEDKEYEIVDGKAQDSMGMIELTWVAWPLRPVIVLALAGMGATPAGSEAIDGRAADVFALDMAKADPAVLAAVHAFLGKGITKAAGKVWIDKETGALLKASLDIEEDVNEPGTKNVAGHGSGHMEIEVSQVGKVTVKAPAL